MLSAVFLLLAVSAGVGVANKVIPALSLAEKLAAGWILNLVIGAWLTLGAAAVFGFSWGIPVVTGILVILLRLSLLSTDSSWLSFFKKKPVRFSHSFGWYLVFWGVIFAFFFWHHSARVTPEGWYTAGNSYGDLALHSSYINYFASQEKLSLLSPVYATENIQYPFLINFYTAVLVKLGWSLQTALIIVGVSTSLAIVTLLYAFCLRMKTSSIVPWLASLLYFINGGVGAYDALTSYSHFSNSLVTFLTTLPVDYSHLPDQGIHWTNMLTSHLLPQRGFMVGLSLVMLVLFIWQAAWETKKNTNLLRVSSLIIGLTPFFHSHSFLVLLPLHIWLLAWAWYRKKVRRVTIIECVSLALLLGLPQVFFLKPDTASESFFKLGLGWMAESENWLVFWLKNMGVHLLLLISSTLYVLRQPSKEKEFFKLLVVPFASIFLICNVVVFQPNVWDNMKFFMLGFFITSLAAGVLLEKLWQKRLAIVVVATVFLGTISGWLALLYEANLAYLMVNTTEIKIAREIQAITPPGSIFLTSDAHNHPLVMVAGRPTVLGYRGWLWTHGINYGKVESDVEQIFAGAPTAQKLLALYNIQYVYISPWERSVYTVNETFFANNYPVVWRNSSSTLYQIY